MARQESDREDLFAEAVALVRRFSGRTTDGGPEIVAGFRDNGWLSIYLGPDPVYTFDAEGRLRRAYRDGFLYRTQGKTLARLRRDRHDRTTSLIRHDLTIDELDCFRQVVNSEMQNLAEQLETSCLQMSRAVPGDDPLLISDIARHLRRTLAADPWLAPALPTKKS